MREMQIRFSFAILGFFLLGLLLLSSRSHVLCDSYMYVEGSLNSDGTIGNLAGYTIYVYTYQPPPEIFSYLPPIGTPILSVKTSESGYFSVTLDVERVSNMSDRIVVLASPNPAKGVGWSVLEVKSGSYILNLTASSLPMLPKSNDTKNIDDELRSLNRKLTEEQAAIKNLADTLESFRMIFYIIMILVISSIISSILVLVRVRGILKISI